MPAPSTLALFALAALALIAIPGPNMVYIATRSIGEGRSAGIHSALGLLTGTALIVAATAAGLSALIASSDLAYQALKYAGAAYLVYLGVKALRSRGGAEAERPSGSAYRQAIVVQLLNPKVALFFVAFLPQFVDPQRGPVATQVLVLGAILGALGFAMDCGYAFAASSAAARLKRFKHGNRVTGAVYIALGAAAALTGRPALILEGDNLAHLRDLPDGIAQMVYTDRPFNTGRAQVRRSLVTTSAVDGDRVGFGGRRYATKLLSESSYKDDFDDYLGFLAPRLEEMWRVLHATGTLYLHLDYREAHYVKIFLDELFGRASFLNELIWAYDYGAKPKGRWPQKHDTILVYVKDPRAYYFDSEAVDREPYMAPGLVTPEKVAKGKRPVSVMWHTIVSPTGKEKTGYPTQKPEGLVRRFVQASSRPGDLCLDPFAGSGTLGAVAAKLDRRYLLIDESPEAVRVMRERLG